MKRLVLGLLVLIGLLVSAPVRAATINAASCSSANVQSAINTAASNDTVSVPAGTCSGWSVTIPNGKNVVLMGAGLTLTHITSGSLNIGNNTGVRVTGFDFSEVALFARGQDFRFDHNRIASASSFFDVHVDQATACVHSRGLFDHNQIQNARIVSYGYSDGPDGNCDWSLPNNPLALGGPQQLFVEDNTYTSTVFTSAVDAHYGGRFTFRHNTLSGPGIYIEFHSSDGPYDRAGRWWEIYDNTIHTTTPDPWAMFIRGGTGVIYNNTVTGAYSVAVEFNIARHLQDGAPWGFCDGTQPLWQPDGSVSPANGYPCRDQIGTAGDTALSVNTPTGMQPQTRQPAYLWNNTLNGGAFTPVPPSQDAAYIVSGRDYFNNTPMPGYVPYTYPHPLQGVPVTLPPNAPTGLTVQ